MYNNIPIASITTHLSHDSIHNDNILLFLQIYILYCILTDIMDEGIVTHHFVNNKDPFVDKYEYRYNSIQNCLSFFKHLGS